MTLKESTKTILETCMGVLPEESVLIITDTATHPSIGLEIGRAHV